MNPANDSVENLVDYLRRYAQEFLEMHQLEGSIKVTGEVPRHEINGTIRRNIFLVLKEALQNVFKHSNSDKVDVNIDIRNDVIRLEVCDSGKGFAVIGEGRHGLGLTSMKRRAEEVGGTLEITSEPGKGTSVVLMFPV